MSFSLRWVPVVKAIKQPAAKEVPPHPHYSPDEMLAGREIAEFVQKQAAKGKIVVRIAINYRRRAVYMIMPDPSGAGSCVRDATFVAVHLFRDGFYNIALADPEIFAFWLKESLVKNTIRL